MCRTALQLQWTDGDFSHGFRMSHLSQTFFPSFGELASID